MILYLAGKMRDKPDYNYPKFDEVARRLRSEGYKVCNPAETLGGVEFENIDRTWCIEKAAKMIPQCDAVAVLDDWWDSPGAKMEVMIGRELNMPIVRAKDPHVRVDVTKVDVEYLYVGPEEAAENGRAHQRL